MLIGKKKEVEIGENRVNAFFNVVADILFLYDLETETVKLLNNRVESILGLTKEEVENGNKTFFRKELLLQVVNGNLSKIKEALNGEVVEGTLKLKHKNGSDKWLYCRTWVHNRQGHRATQLMGLMSDVTKAKQFELDLARQKQYYESILDNIPSGIVVFDKQLKFRYVNKRAVQAPELRRWMIGKTEQEYRQYLHLPLHENTRQLHLQKALDEKTRIEFEDQFTARTGEAQTYLRVHQPVLNDVGNVELIIGNGVNITELKQAQQQIFESQAKNAALISAIPDLMFIVSREGRYVEMHNPNNLDTILSKENIIGNYIQNAVPKKLADELLAHIAFTLDNGGLRTFEYTLDTPTGVKHREARIVQYQDEKVLMIIRDVTSLKENEILIREKNELIRQVMDTSPNPIFVKNKKGYIIFCNDAFSQMLNTTVADVINKTDKELHFSDEQAAFFLEQDQKVFDTMKPVAFEAKTVKKDGTCEWFKTVKSPLVLQSGEVQLLGISVDITAEKLAKERLEQREELYRLLSENSKDLICLHEVDGTYIYLSSAVKELLGYTSNELIGTSPYDLVHPDDLKLFANYTYEEKVQGKSFAVQQRKRRKDGSYIWLETNIRPIIDSTGKVTSMQSSSRDITERKKIVQAMQESEKNYKDLINYSPAFIISHDLNGCIISVNPFTQKELLRTETDVFGHQLKRYLSADQLPIFENYLTHIRTAVSYEGLISVYDTLGTIHVLQFKCYKVEEGMAEPYVIAIGHDITERLQIEEELKKAKEEAEESARAKENFLANMSHEIRTPLNGILGIAGLLSKTTLNDQQTNYLKIIKSSSDNLLVVINDILDTAKISAGKLNIENIPFDVADAVQSAFNTLKYKAEEKDIAYTIKPIALQHTHLVGDPYRLQQVLLNLLNNAIKFTDEGMVSLFTKIQSETDDEVTIQFSVRDTGIGIPDDKIDLVFDGFTQAYASTARKYGGTGLGLHICKNLVEMQGGKIWVESQENLGSIFHVLITYPKSDTQVLVRSATAIDYTVLNNKRVLLAEDNDVNIYLAEAILKGWGVQLDIARNGQEAVNLAIVNRYDAILMDIQMPVLNGLDATAHIRNLADPIKAGVPIIALTANAIKGDAEKYMSMGVNDYVSKPFEEERLFVAIASKLHHPRNPPHLQANSQQAPAGVPNIPPAVAAQPIKHLSTPLYNLKHIFEMANGNRSFVDKTTGIFLEYTPGVLAELETGFQTADWNRVSEAAHKLKPTIDLMYIDSLREVIRSIEENGKQAQQLENMEADIQMVVHTMRQVMVQLAANRLSEE